VYIATKTGPNPKFKRMLMVSSAFDDEEALNKFVGGFSGFYRPAPKEVENAFGGHCGVMLVVNNAVESSAMNALLSRTRSREDGSSVGSGSRKKKHYEGDDLSEDEDEEDEYDDAEEAVHALEDQLANYQSEKQHLLTLNAEWQKKSVALMAREKALQGQTAAARASADMMAVIASSQPGTADPNNSNNAAETSGPQPPQANAATSLEQLEREKQYQDTLQLIVEERNRLNKQLKEFDQLALDLQTRLDDKEFKAKSISTSFKQFKK
jgi:hypothetical protein